MDLVFDIASSAEFWRKRYPTDRTPKCTFEMPIGECASRVKDVNALLPSWADEAFIELTDGRFHALDLNASCERRTQNLHVHKWAGSMPNGAFFQLKEHVYVESPEFMFLHAGAVLSIPKLIAFGDELCGRYSFDESEERGFRKRTEPLSTKKSLERFLARSKSCKGRSKAMKALEYVVDGSASPMETLDELTMCLPYRYGGYGIAKPTMNERVYLTDRAARIAKRDRCYLDMSFNGAKLDVEHHGKYDHSTVPEVASDRARVNALREMKIEVIELTIEQVSDLYAYEYIIGRVASLTGKRLRKENLGATDARVELRRELFEWNRTSGKIR